MKTVAFDGRDRFFKLINSLLLVLVIASILLPVLYILAASFMDPTVLINQGISLDVSDWTLDGYMRVLSDSSILRGFINSFIYSLGFGVMNVLITMTAAYPMSRPDLMFRKPLMIFFGITMFFGGGLVPTYLLIRNIGLLNSPWALILPGCLSVGHLLLATVFVRGLPDEMLEAAKIDGANDIQVFIKLILPLSKPIMFVVFLYSFVAMWNSYFEAMIYISNPDLEPLQLVLRRILVQNQPQTNMIGSQTAMAEMQKIAELIKYSTIVVSSAPLLIMFPFFQKYFEEGVVQGAIKG
ncbi:carbohydrate ABC transporter permease [Fundicoccus ignavus]|uniref:ABC transporter permease subunit n=1 Tax=Fundicoccus ignavus TaxID=2664442 RepID=A0A844C1K7_9LACT|nr:carbohydrate ABC transporter permease [Fundicoccus ignavus]MRI82597.1 ABC transporter permease subunit [Fundicoccus ignavus]MRJ47242.1 ABC transporter permease subunit [Fundicoccus ignavus]